MDKQKKINYVNLAVLGAFLIAVVLRFFGKYFLPEIIKTNIVVDDIFTVLIFFLPFAVFFILTKTNPIKEISLKKMKVSNVLLSIVYAILIEQVMNFFNALSMVFFKSPVNEVIYSYPKKIPFIVAVILVAVLPAIFEETAYRGVVFQNYRKCGKWEAVLLSALLFGLFHGNMNQFSYTIVLGICGALLYEATGSILAPMVVHFFLNAKSIFTVYVVMPYYYKFLQFYYKFAGQYYSQLGMEEEWEQAGYTISDTYDGFVEEMVQAVSQGGTMGTALAQLPIAAGAAILAYLLLKAIAKRCGRLQALEENFLTFGQTTENDENTDEISGKTEETESKILTVPLMLALAIGVIGVFVYETLRLLPKH